MEQYPINRIDDNGDVYAEKDGELVCVGTLHHSTIENAKRFLEEDHQEYLRKLCGGSVPPIKIATVYGKGNIDNLI